MATFRFNAGTADRLRKDLNNGQTVRLRKDNGSAIILRDGLDIDELGEHIYRMSIWPAQGYTIIHRVPMNETDMIQFLMGEKFATYGIVEK